MIIGGIGINTTECNTDGAQRPVRIALLGSTGSVGVQALAVLAQLPPEARAGFQVVALAAGSNRALLEEQCAVWKPKYAGLQQGAAIAGTQWFAGAEIAQMAALPDVDVVFNAIVGIAGLQATLTAARAGKVIALANKESLVAGGQLVQDICARTGASLVPVDSEHSAIFQCLQGLRMQDVREIWLTASGGPFRTRTGETFAHITPQDALRHPKWDMGAKISIDSATLMNKGLEVIEAHWLFGLPGERIQAVVHPESIVHGLVHTADGAMLAQWGSPDMAVPILYALTYPARQPTGTKPLDLLDMTLHFERPDTLRFPCLALAYAALQAGGTATAALNGANEAAVAAFLRGAAGFTDIPRLVERALEQTPIGDASNEKAIYAADAAARAVVERSVVAY